MLFARTFLSGCLFLLLVACTVGPDYQRPDTVVPPTYRVKSPWKEATPRDELPKGNWWEVYGDSVLNQLEEQAVSANQDLRAAFSRMQQVRVRQRLSEADQLPRIDLNGSVARERTAKDLSSNGQDLTGTVFRLPFDLGYEIDLWGRTRRSVEAARADSQSAAADYQSVLLALQAEVARNFFVMRALDNEILLYERTLVLLEDALELVRSQYENGRVSQLSLAQAETERASTEAEVVALRRLRSQSVSAIAVLIGTPASTFSLDVESGELTPLRVAPGLPSSLLERRPDIAAAERQMAAASARIGVAQTAFFPSISLTGHAGFASTEINSLFEWDNRTWGLGPAVYLPIFDAGRNSANLERARLAYEEAVANYRQRVLLAFQEVEDGLQGLDKLDRQATLLQQAVENAEKAWRLSDKRYRSGYVSYLEVIDTQRTALQVARTLIRVQGQQMTTSVFLIKALGGGWEAG